MNKITFFTLLTGLSLLTTSLGCQTTTTNTAANTTAANTTTAAATPAPAATNQASTIETNEPEQYSATITLKAETTGERAGAIPELSAQVARKGADRRVSFNMPNGEQVIYLNKGNTRYLILPKRNQYAELTPEATGFEVPRLMMPDQIADYLKRRGGYTRVGDENMNGRDVVKYRYTGTAQTGTQAGEVNAEAFAYVDKETGLPVRTEFISEATSSVQGVKGVRIVTEVRDITTNVEQSAFEVPQGMKKVTAEEVRQQVSAVVNAAATIAGALLSNLNTQAPAESPSPVATVTP